MLETALLLASKKSAAVTRYCLPRVNMPSEPPSIEAPARKKRLVVFVHGFASDKSCWDMLVPLFRSDRRFQESYDFECADYPTSVTKYRFKRAFPWFDFSSTVARIPSIAQCAAEIENDLEKFGYQQREQVVLVGHSMGGLVIQRFLYDKLRKGIEDLYPLKQVVLIATPSLGSSLAAETRRFLSKFLENAQEPSLRVFDTQISEVRTEIVERIVSPRADDPSARPLLIQCFYGLTDGVVLMESACPFEPDIKVPLNGDHFTVLKPENLQDDRYTRLADAILEPWGLRSVHQVDLYDIRLTVEPVEESREFVVRYGQKSRSVRTDNIAWLNRSVTISRKNRCQDLFLLRYATRTGGAVEPSTIPERNEVDPGELTGYEDNGDQYRFAFKPRAGQTAQLNIKVYKGYDKGQREAHFHLVPSGKKIFYKKVRMTLDLIGYTRHGWAISDSPKLYLHARDEGHDMCAKRKLGTPLGTGVITPEGRFSWELDDLREGVVDVVWDVAKDVQLETPPH